MDLITMLLILAITICSLIYFYFQNAYKYWEKRGFPYLEPKFPKGNNDKVFKLVKNLSYETTPLYDEIKKRSWKFGGVYIISRPVLILVDPDIIGDILTRVSAYYIENFMCHFLELFSFLTQKNTPVNNASGNR